jgi:epoxyqueuosine reductase QueG
MYLAAICSSTAEDFSCASKKGVQAGPNLKKQKKEDKEQKGEKGGEKKARRSESARFLKGCGLSVEVCPLSQNSGSFFARAWI